MPFKYTTQNLNNNLGFTCPFCSSENLSRISKYQEVVSIFHKTENVLVDEYVQCNSCKKSSAFDIFNKTEKIEKKKPNGVVEITFAERGINTDVAYSKGVVKHNYSRYIPNISNRKLYVTTLFLILEYIDMKDSRANILNHDFYQTLTEDFTEANANFGILLSKIQDDKDLLHYVKSYFAACKKEYPLNIVTAILQNSVLFIKNQMLINQDVEMMYFELFNFIEVGELNKARYLSSLIQGAY
jgi:transcription elongation factor Elf1